MVIFTYGINKGGKDIHLEAGGDVSRASEFELRLSGCLDTAVRAAMTEVLQHVKDLRLIETKIIEEIAREAVRDFLQLHPLE